MDSIYELLFGKKGQGAGIKDNWGGQVTGTGYNPNAQGPEELLKQALSGVNPNTATSRPSVFNTDAQNKGLPQPQESSGLLSKIGGAANKVGDFIGTPGGSFLLNLLNQQGYSATPTGGPLGAIGRAGLQTQQQGAARDAADLKKQLIEAQIGLYDANADKARTGRGANPTASNVQSVFTDQDGNINLIRRDGTMEKTDYKEGVNARVVSGPNNSQFVVDGRTGEKIGDLVTQREAIDAAADRAADVTRVEEDERTSAIPKREETKAQTDARLALPGARIAFDKAIGEVNRLRDHPGKSASQGLKGIEYAFGASPKPFPGTDAADFHAIREQAAGGAFLTAYQQLKGGGPITDLEGQAALAAMTRMANPDISETEFDRALDDYIEALEAGYKKLENAAGGNFDVIKRQAQQEIEDL